MCLSLLCLSNTLLICICSICCFFFFCDFLLGANCHLSQSQPKTFDVYLCGEIKILFRLEQLLVSQKIKGEANGFKFLMIIASDFIYRPENPNARACTLYSKLNQYKYTQN